MYFDIPVCVLLISGLSTGEIIGQSLIFFFAGYETTANAVTLTIYNLAVNPDTQEKAYQEIMDIIPEGVCISFSVVYYQ